MHINEYGNKDKPKLILLAPMMVSGEDLHRLMSPYLTGEYFIIAPDQGGHGRAGNYISADEEYAQLKNYLLEKGYTDIELVYGASLGVAVAYRLFLDSDFDVSHAWFDGVAFTKNAPFTEWFMKKLFRQRKRALAKTPVEASGSLVKMYGFDFAKMMTRNFLRITEDDIDAICYACCHYDLQTLTNEQQRKLHLDFGEKDFDLQYSKKAISTFMPKAETVIRKGYPHCGYMAAHIKEYVEELEGFIAGK